MVVSGQVLKAAVDKVDQVLRVGNYYMGAFPSCPHPLHVHHTKLDI